MFDRKFSQSLLPYRFMIVRIVTILMALTALNLEAAQFYCDPVAGSASNQGTADSPWGRLEDVFETGRSFDPGDVIYLRDGYHGHPLISGYNAAYVTIRAEEGHTPTASKVDIHNASRWILSGLVVSPELIGEYDNSASSQILHVGGTSSLITIENCTIYGAEDVYSWTPELMLDRMGTGVRFRARNCSFLNNLIRNIRYGLVIDHQAEGMLARGNRIEGIMEDGIRAIANYSTYEFNLIKDFYGIDNSHDDMIQSWSGGYNGTPAGTSTIYGVVIRGNIGINQTDPSNPFPDTYGVQGLGLFDGFFEDWIIENNIIVTDMWHGISLYGARNCRIMNNTLVRNAEDMLDRDPWLAIYNHKDGSASSGNIVRNNLVSRLGQLNAPGQNPQMFGTTLSNNIVMDDPEQYFVDYGGYDFHLKAGSPAIDAGTETDAPKIDNDRQMRTGSYDVGADEVSNASPVSRPVLAGFQDERMFADATLQVNVTATDDDGDVIALSVAELPGFGELSDNGDGTGLLVFSPEATDSGVYEIWVTADDGILSVSKSFRLVVNESASSDSKLVGHWTFDGTVEDASGEGNHGTLHREPVYSADSADGPEAMSFDGAGDWVIVEDAESLRITGDITLMAYIKPKQSGVMHVFSKSFNEAYRLQTTEDDQLNLILGIPGSEPHKVVIVTDTKPLKINEWQHIAVTVTFDGATGSVSFYRDFSLVSTESISLSGIEDGPGTLLIAGRLLSTTSQLFNGLIDDARIYAGALTEFEIAAMGIETWGGFPIIEGNYVDTGDWVGYLYLLEEEGWAYSYALSRFVYFASEPEPETAGEWIYIFGQASSN